MAWEWDVEELVNRYYRPLYHYALSLTHSEADAGDLAQQTFYIWQTKGHQLRDPKKVKTWLFTTLHREYLNARRRYDRFPHLELESLEHELPAVAQASTDSLDVPLVLAALGQLEEPQRAAVALFYLEDCSYLEIAEILGVPVGTVKSRLSRGLAQLQRLLTTAPTQPQAPKPPRT